MLTYNNTIQRVLGDSPQFCFTGRDAVLPADLMEESTVILNRYMMGGDYKTDPKAYAAELQQRMIIMNEYLAEHLDEEMEKSHERVNVNRKPHKFEIGHLVMRKMSILKNQSSKLHTPWRGPYRIVELVGRNKATILEKGGRKRETVVMDLLTMIDSSFMDKYKHWETVSQSTKIRISKATLEEEGKGDHRASIRTCSQLRRKMGAHLQQIEEVE